MLQIYTIKKTASGFVEQTMQVSAILFHVEDALINVYEKLVFLFRQCTFICKILETWGIPSVLK